MLLSLNSVSNIQVLIVYLYIAYLNFIFKLLTINNNMLIVCMHVLILHSHLHTLVLHIFKTFRLNICTKIYHVNMLTFN